MLLFFNNIIGRADFWIACTIYADNLMAHVPTQVWVLVQNARLYSQTPSQCFFIKYTRKWYKLPHLFDRSQGHIISLSVGLAPIFRRCTVVLLLPGNLSLCIIHVCLFANAILCHCWQSFLVLMMLFYVNSATRVPTVRSQWNYGVRKWGCIWRFGSGHQTR